MNKIQCSSIRGRARIIGEKVAGYFKTSSVDISNLESRSTGRAV